MSYKPYKVENVNEAFRTVVNNAGLDPIQGFDADVWAVDQGTGTLNLVGRFTSIQLTVRNSTEPYLEYNQRIPRQLDGDIQIGWMMERGQLDSRVLAQTFGVGQMTRSMRLNRMPRFQITFAIHAKELDTPAGTIETGGSSTSSDKLNEHYSFSKRKASKIDLVLTHCKVDSFTMGSTAGRTVVANRWEGLAEGIEIVEREQATNPGYTFESLQAESSEFKDILSAEFNPYPWDTNTANTTAGGDSGIAPTITNETN